MPIEPPDLADLDYERVRDLLRSRIPVHTPEWTDHNDSDPGIVILQLFAWLSDQLGYRLNRVPDRNYVSFLQLLGLTLKPATAATTKLALVLQKPETIPERFAVPAGSTAASTVGSKPTFETDIELDAVPAQLGALLTTVASDLRDLNDGADLDAAEDADAWIEDNLSVLWDGKTPKLEEMPSRPVAMGQFGNDPAHTHLWIGLIFNANPVAGFVGQRATLTVQFDDDEQPAALAHATCGEATAEGETPEVRYWWYRPEQPLEDGGKWIELRPISDTTQGFKRSGTILVDIPAKLGPIPDDEWVDLRASTTMTLEEICAAADSDPDAVPASSVKHPLPGSLPISVTGLGLTVPLSGWIAVEWPGATVPALSVRQITFNAVPATAARTVANELVGTGTGKPGQTFTLANGNVLDGTLQLAVEDLSDSLLHDWEEVEDFDSSGPDATVYTLDRESGKLTFGDGVRGRPPNYRGRIVALAYRYGGGSDVEAAAGVVSSPTGMPSQVVKTTNLYAARGGRDAETLDEAKARAPRELKILGRAVTSSDFEFLAKQTESVRVGRALVVPLRRPFDDPDADGPGLDFEADPAAGALSVIVVPEEAGAAPRPTEGMLRAVCEWLDDYRLVTTEVHIVPPMYVRLFDWNIQLYAQPGYSAATLRAAITADLESWLHPLTGGDDGEGFPFGGVLPHSLLLARLFRIAGVARVESLTLKFDGRMPSDEDGTEGEQVGRDERLDAGTLTNCPDSTDEAQVDRILLRDDETVFVDVSTLVLEVLTA